MNSPVKSVEKVKKNNILIIVACLVFLLVMLSLLALGWCFKENGRRLAKAQTNINELKSKINTINASQELIKKKIIFSEASYLVRLANIHLTIEKNAHAAIALLQLARDQLETINTASLLQEAIAQDINKLNTFSEDGFLAVSNALNNIKQSIAKLPISRKFPKNKANESAPTFLGKLKQLFIVKQFDDAQNALTVSDLSIIKNNMEVLLSQAQWALLRFNLDSYIHSLTLVTQDLKQFEEEDVAQIINKLNQLLQNKPFVNNDYSLLSMQRLKDSE